MENSALGGHGVLRFVAAVEAEAERHGELFNIFCDTALEPTASAMQKGNTDLATLGANSGNAKGASSSPIH